MADGSNVRVDSDGPAVAAPLAHTARSLALKAVVRRWAKRDSAEAALDPRTRCKVLEAAADRMPGGGL